VSYSFKKLLGKKLKIILIKSKKVKTEVIRKVGSKDPD